MLKGEPGRLPVFYPHPHGCSPLSILWTDHISGENPCERRFKTNQCKVRRRVYLWKTTGAREIQKFSSSDQRCCLSKGKSCLIDINGCVPFTLSSAFCLWIMYNRSIADGICSDGSSAYFILWPQVRNTAANVDTFHHKLILKTRVWFIFEILEHTSMLVWLVR